MAKCSQCGNKIGMFATISICDSCKELNHKKELAKIAEQIELQKAKEEQQRIQHENEIKDIAKQIWAQVENGQKTYMYDYLYLPVDSVIADEQVTDKFNLKSIQMIGLKGWEIIAVVPRTIGMALTNIIAGGGSSSASWGAGLGGNIAGVYILLKRELGATSTNVTTDELEKYLSDIF